MFCPKCGAEIRDGSEHCDLCLTRLTPDGEIAVSETTPEIEQEPEPVLPEDLPHTPKTNTRLILIIAGVIILSLILCIAGICFAVPNVVNKIPLFGLNPASLTNKQNPVNNMQDIIKQASTSAAEARVRMAVGAAEEYAANSDGSYEEMNAEALNGIAGSPNIKFVDGAPQAGQIGVTMVSTTTFRFEYRDKSGVVCVGEKLLSGEVRITTSGN